jgi:hypothetical protein
MKEELEACLRLQREIEIKTDELALRYKAILEAQPLNSASSWTWTGKSSNYYKANQLHHGRH